MASARGQKRSQKDASAVRLAAKRAAKLSAARRSEIARQAARARWNGPRTAKGGRGVPSIEDLAAELASDVPAEEWNRLPADLSNQLDHYLYGWPKRRRTVLMK